MKNIKSKLPQGKNIKIENGNEKSEIKTQNLEIKN
jgi:hypothetical protein